MDNGKPKPQQIFCHYMMVTAEDPNALAAACTKALADAYVPVGGPMLVPGAISPRLLYVQAMYKVVAITDEDARKIARERLGISPVA